MQLTAYWQTQYMNKTKTGNVMTDAFYKNRLLFTSTHQGCVRVSFHFLPNDLWADPPLLHDPSLDIPTVGKH